MNLGQFTGVPELIAADTGHALIHLDTQTGKVQALTAAARTTWRARKASPTVVTVGAATASWGTDETAACLHEIPVPPLRWLPRAAAAMALTLAVRNIGPRRRAFARMTLLAYLATRVGSAAPRHDTLAALRVVQWVARYVPARVACLEESTAALVALALRGCHAEWCHGVACDPVPMHAWIEVDRLPVGRTTPGRSSATAVRSPTPWKTGLRATATRSATP